MSQSHRTIALVWGLVLSALLPAQSFAVGFNIDRCREQVEVNLCGRSTPEEETCHAVAPQIGADILAIFDRYPQLFQKLMCAAPHIVVLDRFYASGAADWSGNVSIRADLADRSLTLASWATWKEQLPFSDELKRYRFDLFQQFITAIHETDLNGLMLFILSHELAHVLANRNDLMSEDTPFSQKGKAVDISADILAPAGAEGICFYTECPPIKGAARFGVYEALYKKGFLTLYGLKSQGEDFADSVALYLMHELVGLRYFVHLPDGTVYDVVNKFNAPEFQAQTAYVRDLLAREDLKTEAPSPERDEWGYGGITGGVAGPSDPDLDLAEMEDAAQAAIDAMDLPDAAVSGF